MFILLKEGYLPSIFLIQPLFILLIRFSFQVIYHLFTIHFHMTNQAAIIASDWWVSRYKGLRFVFSRIFSPSIISGDIVLRGRVWFPFIGHLRFRSWGLRWIYALPFVGNIVPIVKSSWLLKRHLPFFLIPQFFMFLGWGLAFISDRHLPLLELSFAMSSRLLFRRLKGVLWFPFSFHKSISLTLVVTRVVSSIVVKPWNPY